MKKAGHCSVPSNQTGECTVGFPLIWAVLSPTHGWLPFAPLIDIPKGFSSKMTLEVAPRGLDIATVKV